ncbi:hypothetical protein [Roseibium sp. SCP14]|uniref:hypothetical protein n=1 Tax=Roseibium sp. SCP14 TaxID=3141375 RepID=UPI0033368417
MSDPRIAETDEYFIWHDERDNHRYLVLKGPWQSRFKPVMEQFCATGLRLSRSLGWQNEPLTFLEELPELTGLEIYDWDVKDLTPLASLPGLQTLGLQCRFASAPDFLSFSRLQNVYITWRPRAEALLLHEGLTRLSVENYPGDDLTPLARLNRLKELRLTSRKLSSLLGIGNLPALKRLDLYSCPKLSSVEPLTACNRLKTLEIETCKQIGSLNGIEALSKLKTLHLINCGKLPTLRPLAGLRELERFHFHENTTILDGDLSVLLELPSLAAVSFADKSSYRPRRDEVLSHIGSKLLQTSGRHLD